MSNGVALYHPYMRIFNEEWLKQALLYWDSLRRIIPNGFSPEDHGDIKRATDEELLIATDPKPYLVRAGEKFKEKSSFLFRAISGREQERGGDLELPRHERINPRTLDLKGQELLIEEAKTFAQEDWRVADSCFVGCYLSCLASVIGEQFVTPMVTDCKIGNSIGEYFTVAPISEKFVYDSRKAPTFLRLRIPFPHKLDLYSVSMDDIIYFRKRYADERRNLREALEELLEAVPEIDDPLNLIDHLRAKQARLEKAIDDHQSAANCFHLRAVPAVLQITVRTGGIAWAQMAGLPQHYLHLLGAGMVASLAFAWWSQMQNAHFAFQGSPYQYILTMQNYLAGQW